MSTAALLVAVAGLLLTEAFFALSEVALVSAGRERLRARAEAGSRAAACAWRMLGNPERLLATALIGTNLCLVGAAFVANEAAARILGPERSAWAIAALAPLILLFAEILPKVIARRHADRLAPIVAYPIRAAMIGLAPAVLVGSGLSRALVGRLRGGGRRHPFVTKEELRAIVLAERRAALDPEEARLISRLLGMAGARVREIMTPLPDVVSIPSTAPLQEAIAAIRRHGYSRIPVWEERTDNIVGVVHAMDLILNEAPQRPLAQFLRRPFYVPEAGRLERLLDDFRRLGHEMAIVVDEYGAASGIVTMEDLLEELVGDILDEFDRPARAELDPAGDGAFVAEGLANVGDLSERLGLALPREGYETLAGFITHRLQRIPKAGDRVEFEGVAFTVLEATDRRVRKVRIETPRARS